LRDACVERLGLMPWDVERLTVKEARQLLSRRNEDLETVVEAIHVASAQVVSCFDGKAAKRMMEH
jgi:hypothetical protein